MSKKILVTGTSVDDHLLQPLRDAGYQVHNPTHLLSESELKEELSDSVAYLLGGDELATAVALSTAHSLKIIAFLGVGYESFVDVKSATSRGILVANTPGTLTNSVAEFTIGQLLNARRRLTEYTNAYMQGVSNKEAKQRDLATTNIGIIGLGAIGTRIAEILRSAFKCNVRYFSRTRKPEVERHLGIEYMAMSELTQWAEALVIMTPGNDATRNLIGREVLQLIPVGAQRLLVNTARASIVDPEALLAALKDDRIALAVFDGFYDETDALRSSLLALGQSRILVTGHIASLTSDARDGMARKSVASILNVLANHRDDCVVNVLGAQTS